MILYHYTCSHGVPGITATGQLRPNPHPLLPTPLVWLTDLEQPWRDALGLTSHTLRCDRTAHRFTADTDAAVWWPRYARRLDVQTRRTLELQPGSLPAHWWVSEEPLHVRPAAA